ncbi:MAG: methyl-accepting chemotaxis protein, partial [Brevinema sp.]
MKDFKHFKEFGDYTITMSDIRINNTKLIMINLLMLFPLNALLLFLWSYLEFYLPNGIVDVLLEHSKTITISNIKINIPIFLMYLFIAHIVQLIAYFYYLFPIHRLFLHSEEQSIFSQHYVLYGFHYLFWFPLVILLFAYNKEIGTSQLVPHFTKSQLLILQNGFIIILWYISSKIFELSNQMIFHYFQTHRFCTYQLSKLYYNKIRFSLLLFATLMFIFIFHIHPFIRFYTQNNYPPYHLVAHIPQILLAIGTIIFYSFLLNNAYGKQEENHMHLFEIYLEQMVQQENADFSHMISPHQDKITLYFNKYIVKISDSLAHTQKINNSFNQSLKNLMITYGSLNELPRFDESSDAFNSLSHLSQYISKIVLNFQESLDKLNHDFKDNTSLSNETYYILQLAYEIKYQCSLCISNASIIMNKLENTMKKSKIITDSMHSISQNIKSGGTEAEFIDEILLLLQDIAEQTNILSINAALEAAHAGNAGKGFAIVSNEVRALATASSDAVDDISQKLISIQNFIKIAVAKVSNLEQITDENHMLITESHTIMRRVIENFRNIELVASKTCASTDLQGKMSEQAFNNINNFLSFLDTYHELLKKQQNDIQLLREKTIMIPMFEKETLRNMQDLLSIVNDLGSIKNNVSEKLSEITKIKNKKTNHQRSIYEEDSQEIITP